MDGYEKFHSLKATLFNPKSYSYPELKELSYEQLIEKKNIAKAWIDQNPDHPKMKEAKRKYDWIIHYAMKKAPKKDNLSPQEVLEYLL